MRPLSPAPVTCCSHCWLAYQSEHTLGSAVPALMVALGDGPGNRCSKMKVTTEERSDWKEEFTESRGGFLGKDIFDGE